MTEPERFDVLVVAAAVADVLRDGVLAHPTMATGLNQLFASWTE